MTNMVPVKGAPTAAADELPPPSRGLSEACIEELRRLASQSPEEKDGAWWRAALLDPELIVAIRKDTLNVYYRGGSIFEASFIPRQGMQVRTHAKYLVRSKQNYVTLGSDSRFSASDTLWDQFDGPATLKEMMKAAERYAGPEKTGVHRLVRKAPNVIDLELALWGRPIESKTSAPAAEDEVDVDTQEAIEVAETIDEEAWVESDTGRKQRRLDVVSIEAFGGGARIAFHEAKHFVNGELRAKNGPPPVIEQIKKYELALKRHEAALVESYTRVCKSLVAIEEMRATLWDLCGKSLPKRSAEAIAAWDLISGVATGRLPLSLDLLPRLVVFGYDEDQWKGRVWTGHRKKLADGLPAGTGAERTYFVGNAKGSPIAFDLRKV